MEFEEFKQEAHERKNELMQVRGEQELQAEVRDSLSNIVNALEERLAAQATVNGTLQSEISSLKALSKHYEKAL